MPADPVTAGEIVSVGSYVLTGVVKYTKAYTFSGRMDASDKRLMDSARVLSKNNCAEYLRENEKQRLQLQFTKLKWDTGELRTNGSSFDPKTLYKAAAKTLKKAVFRATAEAAWDKEMAKIKPANDAKKNEGRNIPRDFSNKNSLVAMSTPKQVGRNVYVPPPDRISVIFEDGITRDYLLIPDSNSSSRSTMIYSPIRPKNTMEIESEPSLIQELDGIPLETSLILQIDTDEDSGASSGDDETGDS